MLLHDNCELNNTVFDAESIIFGSPIFDNLLNELILLGRRMIFRKKKETELPGFIEFIRLVKLNYRIDIYNAVKNQTQFACEKKWDKYRELLYDK